MTILESCKLMNKYAKCPKCGCEVVGNGKGTLECDTEKGYFKRTCHCGWYIEIKNNEIIDDSCCMAYNPDGRVYMANKNDLDHMPKLSRDDIITAVNRNEKYMR